MRPLSHWPSSVRSIPLSPCRPTTSTWTKWLRRPLSTPGKDGNSVADAIRAEIEDTFAEAFRGIYAEVLVTARDRRWLDHAVHAATGNASSTILCDCEAGLDRYVGLGGDDVTPTPDGRPGAVLQFHVPRFRKDREKALARSLLVRI